MARRSRARGSLIAIEGPSGAGKTTLVLELARVTGGLSIPEAYDRLGRRPSLAPRSRSALLKLEVQLLREERRRMADARSLARQGSTVYLDTGFLGPVTYADGLARIDPRWDVRAPLGRAFSRLMRPRAGVLPDRTVILEAPERTLRRRATLDPSGHPARLAGRHRRVARRERELWNALARRLLPGRVLFVSAQGAPATVAARILRRLARDRLPPPTSSERAAVFEEVEARARAIVKRRGPSRRPSP